MTNLEAVKLDEMFQRQERILERLVHLEKLILLSFVAERGEDSTQSWIRQTPNLEAFARDVRKWFAETEGVLDDDSGSP